MKPKPVKDSELIPQIEDLEEFIKYVDKELREIEEMDDE